MNDTLNENIYSDCDIKVIKNGAIEDEINEQRELFIELSGSIKYKRKLKKRLICFVFFDVVFTFILAAFIVLCTVIRIDIAFIIPVLLVIFLLFAVCMTGTFVIFKKHREHKAKIKRTEKKILELG